MYSKKDKVLSTSELNLDSFIENNDIYNSKFIYLLRMLPHSGTYQINLTKHRIDLISKDIYDSESYSELLLIYNGLSISELNTELVIKFPSLEHLSQLISKINNIKSPREFLKTLSLN